MNLLHCLSATFLQTLRRLRLERLSQGCAIGLEVAVHDQFE